MEKETVEFNVIFPTDLNTFIIKDRKLQDMRSKNVWIVKACEEKREREQNKGED